MPPELRALDQAGNLHFEACFRTVDWNRELFDQNGLRITDAGYFPDAYMWRVENLAQYTPPVSEGALIRQDRGRWLSLGMVVGRKGSDDA